MWTRPWIIGVGIAAVVILTTAGVLLWWYVWREIEVPVLVAAPPVVATAGSAVAVTFSPMTLTATGYRKSLTSDPQVISFVVSDTLTESMTWSDATFSSDLEPDVPVETLTLTPPHTLDVTCAIEAIPLSLPDTLLLGADRHSVDYCAGSGCYYSIYPVDVVDINLDTISAPALWLQPTNLLETTVPVATTLWGEVATLSHPVFVHTTSDGTVHVIHTVGDSIYHVSAANWSALSSPVTHTWENAFTEGGATLLYHFADSATLYLAATAIDDNTLWIVFRRFYATWEGESMAMYVMELSLNPLSITLEPTILQTLDLNNLHNTGNVPSGRYQIISMAQDTYSRSSHVVSVVGIAAVTLFYYNDTRITVVMRTSSSSSPIIATPITLQNVTIGNYHSVCVIPVDPTQPRGAVKIVAFINDQVWESTQTWDATTIIDSLSMQRVTVANTFPFDNHRYVCAYIEREQTIQAYGAYNAIPDSEYCDLHAGTFDWTTKTWSSLTAVQGGDHFAPVITYLPDDGAHLPLATCLRGDPYILNSTPELYVLHLQTPVTLSVTVS